MVATKTKLQLQIPTLLDKPDADLQTAADDDRGGFPWADRGGKAFPYSNTLAGAAAPGLAQAWIDEATQADDPVVGHMNSPEGSCYRNATLAALMNCSPFLNFIAHGKFDHLSTCWHCNKSLETGG